MMVGIGLAQSVFLTVAVTLERHHSVCNPVEYEARVMARLDPKKLI
jgi:hypothetical protein